MLLSGEKRFTTETLRAQRNTKNHLNKIIFLVCTISPAQS